MDLVIRGGRIITAGDDAVANIGIVGETVAQIGGEMRADQEIDAAGKLVLPGGIDAHVHLTVPPTEQGEPNWVDNFTSGSAAALAGGITSVGNMSFPAEGESPFGTLEREGELAAGEAIADVFLHPVLEEITPATLDQITRLRERGCSSIKYFMVSPGFDRQSQEYVEATRLAGSHGILTMIHCEDHALVRSATAQLVATGRTSLRYYAESAPVVSEVVAVQRAVGIAEVTGAPVYVVHLSSARALETCAEAQRRGLPVYVETRPLYLHLTSERLLEEEGGKYIGQPPLRERGDVAALWAGIEAGTVHTVCSDHAPWTLEAKLDPSLTVANVRPGVENLQTLLPMLYSEGVRTGRISLRRFVEVTSANAARLFGLYPRKGTIAVGSDADLTILDPDLTRTVERSMLHSNAGYSVYEGWEVTGWPVMTIRRGEIVYRNGSVLGAAGSGQLLHRAATASL